MPSLGESPRNDSSASVPRAGMLAIARNRRGVVAAVEPFQGEAGTIHLVHVEYKDAQSPPEEKLPWELEPQGELLEPNALPRPDDDPMAPADFDALVRAARWTALSPYLDPDGEGPLRSEPIANPFHDLHPRAGEEQAHRQADALDFMENLDSADDVSYGA